MHQYLLQHLLEESANRFPHHKAVVFNDSSVSYAELNQKSDQLSQVLMEFGVKAGDRVGFQLGKSIESIICIFGILKAGAAYVPIDPLAPVNRAKYIINNCEIRIIVTTEQNASNIVQAVDNDLILKKVIVTDGGQEALSEQYNSLEFFLWESLLASKTNSIKRMNISDTRPAYILHTSGSTGTPKGVVISHHNSLSYVNATAEFFDVQSSDKLCCHAPLHFDLSVFDIFVAVKCGATIVLVPEYLSLFPSKLAEYIIQKQITIWNSVASVIVILANYENIQKYIFDSLRLVIFSGEVLPTKYLRIIKNCTPKADFYNTYGQTEANSSTFYLVEDIPEDDTWKMPIGRPFQNFEVFSLNDDNEVITRPGEEGELYVKSSTVAIGYWRDEEKTSQVFIPDPSNRYCRSEVYKTGDLVTLDNEGNYVLVGRKDRVVKTRGYRIELDEIEYVLNNHPLVNQAAVINITDELIGNIVIAYVAPIKEQKIETSDLIDYCSKILPRYMVPDPLIIYDSLPTTPNGKIDRNALKNEAMLNYENK